MLLDGTLNQTHASKATLVITLWNKGFLKNELLGQLSFPIYHLVNILLFDDPENKPNWYPLVNPRQEVSVAGDVRLKMGFGETLNKDLKALFLSFNEKMGPYNGFIFIVLGNLRSSAIDSIG